MDKSTKHVELPASEPARTLAREIAELRIENERLQVRGDRFWKQLCQRTEMLNDANAENERLRAALHRIRHLCNGASYVGHPVISEIFAEAGRALGRDNCP